MTPEESFDNIIDAIRYRNIKTEYLFGSTDIRYFIWDIIAKKEVF